MAAAGAAFQGIGRLYVTRIDLLAGKLDAASAQLIQDLDEDHRTGRGSAELLRRYLLARIHLLRGQSGEARQEAARIAGTPATAAKATNLQQAAEVFVHVGDIVAARELLQRLSAIAAETPPPLHGAVCTRCAGGWPWHKGSSNLR